MNSTLKQNLKKIMSFSQNLNFTLVNTKSIFLKSNIKLFSDLGSKINTISKQRENKTPTDSIKNSTNFSNSNSNEFEKLLRR